MSKFSFYSLLAAVFTLFIGAVLLGHPVFSDFHEPAFVIMASLSVIFVAASARAHHKELEWKHRYGERTTRSDSTGRYE